MQRVQATGTIPLEVPILEVSQQSVFQHIASKAKHLVEVGQRGRRGAVEGKVTVLIYEGEPLYTGSVTVGPLG